MANRYAVATGNWSNPAIWDGGTLPQAGDVVRPNGFIVTIDQDITVTELTNNASSPAVNGGRFTFGAGRIITANIIVRVSPGTGIPFVTATYGSGTSTINGNVLHLAEGTNSSVISITGLTNGILIFNGDIYHGGSSIGNDGLRVVNLLSDGGGFKVICNGLVSGSQSSNGGTQPRMYGIVSLSNYIIELNGITQGKTNINGSDGQGVRIEGSNNLIINNGVMLGGNSSSIYSSPAVSMPENTLNELRHYGISTATLGQNAVGGGLVVLYDGCVIQDNFTCIAHRPRAQRFATSFMDAEQVLYIDALTTKKFLTAGLLTGYPLEADVESGVTYGPVGEFTGTLDPVTVNVTVDTNAIAAAISTSLETSLPPLLAPPLATDLLTEISTSSDPLAERLRNASTVQTTGAQLQSLVIAP